MKSRLTTLNKHTLRGFRLKSIVGFTALLAMTLGIRELTYLDIAPIMSPVTQEGTLVIRADGMGEGYFGASRSGGRRHKGLDLSAPLGSPVMAAKSGRIVESKRSPKGMGEYVVIAHRGGVTTLYGHLKERYIQKGQRVRQGQVIGAVGKTGNAKHKAIKSHLHFELAVEGGRMNPASEEWLEAMYTIEQPPRTRVGSQARGGSTR